MLGRPGRTASPAVLAGILLAAAACGDGAAPAYTVRDSAGVRIVENEAPRGAAVPWRVGEAPLADIGVLEGDEVYQLFDVGGLVRLTDGRIAVANSGTNQIRFFDAEGRYLSTVGRQGGGPGEFEGLGPIAVLGDSLVAYDWTLTRFSIFTLDGAFVRSVRVVAEQNRPLGTFDDGRWLFTSNFSFVPSPVSQVVRDTTLFVIVGTDGAVTDTIGRFPAIEFFVMSTAQQGRASSLVFGRTTQQAVAGRHAYIAPTDRYEIFRYTGDGHLDQIVRKRHDPLPVTAADIDARKQERLDEAFNDSWRQTMERMFLEMPIPATMPAFDRLRADAAGNLWVLEYARPGDATRRWTVFGPDGVALGVVQTPPGMDVLQIGDDFVLGTWRDDMDVEHVQMYALTRTPEE